MRPTALLCLLSLLLACKAGGSPKLEGKWKGVRAEGVSAETQAQADTFATATEIVAKGDQISITTPGAKAISAKYTVERDDKSSLVIRTDKDQTTETFAFGDDPKQMTWRVDEQKSIVFKKE